MGGSMGSTAISVVYTVHTLCAQLPAFYRENHFFNSHLLAWHLVTGGWTTSIKVTSILAPIGPIIKLFVKHSCIRNAEGQLKAADAVAFSQCLLDAIPPSSQLHLDA